jgi:hypothetical protein
MAAVITLVHGGGGAVADAVMLARAIRRIIREDLGWPFGYNLLLVRLAAAGILLPVLAAVAIATSSVTVVGNAPWLRRSRPVRQPRSRSGRARTGPWRRSLSYSQELHHVGQFNMGGCTPSAINKALPAAS